MKIILFGATGLAGSALLTHLLQAGNRVTAFVRTPSKIKINHTALQIMEGDVLIEENVTAAVEGHDTVVSAISEGPTIVHYTQSKGVAQILNAMKEKGLQRIVAMGSAGILQRNVEQLVRDVGYPAAYYPISEEQYQVFQQLQRSGLQWTQVCPPLIIDKEANGAYVTQKNYAIKGGHEVYAGNIGDFVAKELAENNYLQTRVAIANA
jgi:putative NADH-flavin reductase